MKNHKTTNDEVAALGSNTCIQEKIKENKETALAKQQELCPKVFNICTSKDIVKFIKETKPKGWIILSKSERKAKNLLKDLEKYDLKLDSLYIYKEILIFNVSAPCIKKKIKNIVDTKTFDIKSCYSQDKIVKLPRKQRILKFCRKTAKFVLKRVGISIEVLKT